MDVLEADEHVGLGVHATASLLDTVNAAGQKLKEQGEFGPSHTRKERPNPPNPPFQASEVEYELSSSRKKKAIDDSSKAIERRQQYRDNLRNRFREFQRKDIPRHTSGTWEHDLQDKRAEGTDNLYPPADIPTYAQPLPTLLQRYAQCHAVFSNIRMFEHMSEDVVADWAVQYAFESNPIEEYQQTINLFMLVSALAFTMALPALVEPPENLEEHDSLRDVWLYLTFASVICFTMQLGLGVFLYDCVTRKPFGELDAWIMLAKFWNAFLAFGLLLPVALILQQAAIAVQLFITYDEGAGRNGSIVMGICYSALAVFGVYSNVVSANSMQFRKFEFLVEFTDFYASLPNGKCGSGNLKVEWARFACEKAE